MLEMVWMIEGGISRKNNELEVEKGKEKAVNFEYWKDGVRSIERKHVDYMKKMLYTESSWRRSLWHEGTV